MVTGLFLAALLGQQVIKGPSFDCTAALEPVEDAICNDATLARLDLRLNARYVAVRRGLSADGRRALTGDQRRFLAARNEWFENRDRWSDFPDLKGRMTDRIAFLDAMDTGRIGGLGGRWSNVAGEADIVPAGDEGLRVSINTANPVNARWICNVEFTGKTAGRVVEGVPDGEPGYRLRAELNGDVLQIVETQLAAESYGPGYCGANGSVAGAYFRVR